MGAAAKALSAKKKTVKGRFGTRVKKVRTVVKFRRPKTLRLKRAPKFPKKSVPNRDRMDAYSVIRYPLTTESSMKKIEDNNTLVFIVNLKANKPQIREAVRKLYEIDVCKVNTLIRPDGIKGLRSLGARLRCSGCRQQNRNHINFVSVFPAVAVHLFG